MGELRVVNVTPWIVQLVRRRFDGSAMREQREACERIEADGGPAAVLLALARHGLPRMYGERMLVMISEGPHGSFVAEASGSDCPTDDWFRAIAIAEPPRAAEPPP